MTEADNLRHEPVQFRSAETLAKLEAAAIAMIALHGREGFTTKHIADHAGVSVGTTYRYFVNRAAVLKWVYPDHVEGLGEPRKGAGQPFLPSEG
jgi:AcrR family transcriptional regulator